MPGSVKKVLFRVDSATMIGAGHVMRCLTLAEALRAEGADCRFICRDLPGAIQDKVRDARFDLTVLPAPATDYSATTDDPAHAPWLGVSWQDDLTQTKAVIDGPVDWLVVDHYGIDVRWHKGMRAHASRIAVIDELADRPLDCDVLVCQSLPHQMISAQFDQCLSENVVRNIGPDYALLRPEFVSVRDRAVARRNLLAVPQRVFVANGYMDAGGLVPLALKALRDFTDLAVDVAIGSVSPVIAEVRALANALPHVSLYEDASDMAGLMAQADLAIGGGGVSSFERATVGLPTLAVSVADNQTDLLRFVAAHGAVSFLGTLDEVTTKVIRLAVQGMLDDPAHWQQMASDSLALCDGQGAARVVETMQGLSV